MDPRRTPAWPRAQHTLAPQSTPAVAASCCTRPWTACRSTRSPEGCTCCARRILPGCRPWAAGSRTACGRTPACGCRRGRRRAGRWSGRRSVSASASSCPSYKHGVTTPMTTEYGTIIGFSVFRRKRKNLKKILKKNVFQ